MRFCLRALQKYGTRHTLAAAGFFGILNVYFCRINLSMAIVAMVGRESVHKAGTNVTLCPAFNDSQSYNESEELAGILRYCIRQFTQHYI